MLDAGYGDGSWIDGVFSSLEKALEAGYLARDIEEFVVDEEE